MTHSQRTPGQQDPFKHQDHHPPTETEVRERAPFLPGWISRGGWIPLALVGLILLIVCINAGTSYGAPDGWSLLGALALPCIMWLWSSFARRTEKLRLHKRMELRARIKIREIDRLGWQDFEMQCIILLQLLGFTNVKKTKNLPGEKAVDITATAAGSGIRMIFECKHRTRRPVDVGEVNELIGRIASGKYVGFPVTLMTNARVTAGALEKAAKHNIRIIDRGQLAELMMQVSNESAKATSSPQTSAAHDQGATAETPGDTQGPITTWFSALRPETKLATAVTAAGCLTVLALLLQMTVTGPRLADRPLSAPRSHPAANSSSTARPPTKPAAAGNDGTPQAVARRYFIAISDHDWPEVWKLGGKNVSRGPSATYQGMVSGYRDTIRDVPEAMTVTGATVSGRFLAYEAGNRVQTYAFAYNIRDGAIVSASVRVVATAG